MLLRKKTSVLSDLSLKATIVFCGLEDESQTIEGTIFDLMEGTQGELGLRVSFDSASSRPELREHR